MGSKWVETEPRSITIEWIKGDDESSICMQIRNQALHSLVLLAFQLCGSQILEVLGPSKTRLQIPDFMLKKLPRTRGLRKKYQRRQFLQMFPFLVCNQATDLYEQYIETIPERPSSFAEAIMESRYVPFDH